MREHTTVTLDVARRSAENPFTNVAEASVVHFRRSARRLRGAARWFALGYVTAHLLSEFVRHTLRDTPYDFDVVYWILLASVMLAAIIDRIARPGPLNHEQLIRLGLFFEVLASLLIGLGIHAEPYDSLRTRGVSWIALWVVMYPLVLRSTPKQTTLASFTSAAMDPLSLLFWSFIGERGIPQFSLLFELTWPTFLCAGLASLGARIIFRLRTEQERAQLLGTYELERLIGLGGMGEVWKARHAMLMRPAAVKLVRRERVMQSPTDRSVLQRFEREAQATAWLNSPHTVRLFDFGVTTEGILYYVMEYLEGLNLQDAVKSFGPFPSERVAYILSQVCQSLAEAHRKGMVHRDVKPANIFIGRAGTELDFAKVLDFGLVKPQFQGLRRLTSGYLTTGTPGFMAPEHIEGREIDERADVYSLGCLGYWLLTGTLVFEGENAVQIALKHVRDGAQSPSTRTELSIDPELEAFVMRCLCKEPRDRPSSCLQLEQQLCSLEFATPWTQDRAVEWWRLHKPELVEACA